MLLSNPYFQVNDFLVVVMRILLPVIFLSALLFTGLFANHPNTDGSVEQKIRIKAEQGDAELQNNLGAMYANGEGVAQDDKQAAFWFCKAAD